MVCYILICFFVFDDICFCYGRNYFVVIVLRNDFFLWFLDDYVEIEVILFCFFLFVDLSMYYWYLGSLIMFFCYEMVIWIVFKEIIKVFKW